MGVSKALEENKKVQKGTKKQHENLKQPHLCTIFDWRHYFALRIQKVAPNLEVVLSCPSCQGDRAGLRLASLENANWSFPQSIYTEKQKEVKVATTATVPND